MYIESVAIYSSDKGILHWLESIEEQIEHNGVGLVWSGWSLAV